MPRTLHLHSTFHPSMTTTGMTLVELLIVAALIGTLSAIAFPSILRYRDTLAVSGAITDAAAFLHHTRQLAITQQIRVSVIIDTASGTLTQLLDATPATPPDTLTKRPIGTLHHVSLSATRPRLTYLPTGSALGGSNLTLVATRNTSADTLTISRLGRVKY